MSETHQGVCDSSFEELANKTIEDIDKSSSDLGSFEEIAVESFQELEKYNDAKLSSGDLQRLLEKTRQRREVLNQKLGKTPEVTPRKRILEQNQARENVPAVSLTSKDGSPGKRQCVRGEENMVHPDTPAINGVKSRMHALTKQREQFSEKDSEMVDISNEPTMQKVTTTQREATVAFKENIGETTSTGRRGRFAHLAQAINNWEDDLSHPTIQKPEEPKPRWQPPKPANEAPPAKPPRVEADPSPPQQSVKPPPAPPAPAVPSPKKTYAPQPPTAQSSAAIKLPTNSVCKSVLDKTKVPKEKTEDQTTKSVSERLNTWRASETPKKEKPVDPSQQPVSAKKAVWEQKISTPTATVSKVYQPVRQMATPVSDKPQLPKPQSSETQNPNITAAQPEVRVEKDDPAAQPVSARMASWQQRTSESTPRKEEEPTAYSVTARMSAWEEMSSSNKVSYIKKVDPGSVSPGKKSPVKAPVFGSAKKPTPVKAIGQTSENKAVTPTKAVKDHLMQKADHIKSSMESPQQMGGNPGKIGSATKMMQQKLFEQATHGKTADVAEKLRRERMEEVQKLQHRHDNGILKEGRPEKTPSDTEDQKLTSDIGNDRRETIRAKARADDNSDASYDFNGKKGQEQPGSQAKPPMAPSSQNAKSKPSPSIYRLISQKRNEKPSMSGDTDRKSDDSFDSTEDEELYTRRPQSSTQEEEATTDDGMQRLASDSESDVGHQATQPMLEEESDCDDVSFSAFVPASVRRQSVLPSGPHQESEPTENRPKPTVNPVAPVPSSYRSGSNLVGYQQQSSSSSLESTSSEQSSYSSDSRRYSVGDDTSDSAEINDLLDEAMSDEEEEAHGTNKPRVAPRKRRSHMMATSEDNAGNLVYSVSMYRSRRYLHEPNSSKKKIVRNREFDDSIREEDIEMPTQLPPEVERKSIQERIQELQELVSQEQSVIMQTSNALNQCCSSNSYFQGSPEQVECNRLLLIACQKRQAYLTEIQRLKETGCLDPPGSGPRGSLTISDIRLPLKKEFVTKIGTASDNTVHYFLLLIRNHAQVIVTQMLSTHDPMMRGSLDFPNLIKIHGICGNFKLNLEIYSMSISREAIKDKKRKTPKKLPKGHLAPDYYLAPSPGGPTAVRTTSFTLITSLPITMRALDKTCFTLERIPYLSPLHGTIYMRLKCLMEQNVEERGFLTMFEDVSGFGAWHRRWSALQGNKLCFWKYPDEETRKEPMGIIDLKRCVTEKVGLIPRDVCARPNTFELVTVRQPRRGEEDTLVSKTYNTMTSIRHMVSADTKEERINWCNKINRALANIRTWHSDALRPIKLPTTKE